MIQFSKLEAGKKTVDFKMPEKEIIGKYLWLVYYKQQDFKRKNNHYANNLKELELPENAEVTRLNLTATAQQFTVKTLLKDGSIISINETGLFLTNK